MNPTKLIFIILLIVFNHLCYGQIDLKKKIVNTYWKLDTIDKKLSNYKSGERIVLKKGISQNAYLFKKNGKFKVVRDYAFCGTTTWWEDMFSKDVIFQKDKNGKWKMNFNNNIPELTIKIKNEKPIVVNVTKIEDDQMMMIIK